MKKMLLNFADSLISKEQMSKVKGGCGGDVHCTVYWDTAQGCGSQSYSFSAGSQNQAVTMVNNIMASDSSLFGYNLTCG